MKKLLFFICLASCSSLFAQKELNLPFARLMKISSTDSLVTIQPAVKNQLNPILNNRKNNSAVTKHFLFSGANKNSSETISRWMAAKLHQDLYRIDLSAIISKYIGETEKNLDMIFQKAENKNWILFFDEADALFDKRTNVNDAHDKYANQETEYLLDRIEKYQGIVVLTCNSPECKVKSRKNKFIEIAVSGN